MRSDYGLLVDPCADVESISTKGHRTYTFEQPNSLGVDELSTFFEVAWEKYPQHFAVVLLGHRATSLEPLCTATMRRTRGREVGSGPPPDPAFEDVVGVDAKTSDEGR